MDDLWPKECAGDDQPDLEVAACFSCDQFQPDYTRHFTDAEKLADKNGKVGVIRICESVLRGIYGGSPDDRAGLEKPTHRYDQCGAW